MTLENKVKRAALDTALKHQLKNRNTSKERVCRNLLDFGMQLENKHYTAAQLKSMQKELSHLLGYSTFPEIKEWLVKKFL